MSQLTPEIVDDLKGFNWDAILEKGNGLEDLNDSQWRFIKGLVAELTVEKFSNDPTFKYVGAVHKDYDWEKHNISVELKSQLSGGMYGKRGKLSKNFTIKLNNSNGTNKKATLDSSDVADILIVVRNDGAFVIDKDLVMKRATPGGDGFNVIVSKDEITELTGRKIVNKSDLGLKAKLIDAIKNTL
jgi:hypothetical protein